MLASAAQPQSPAPVFWPDPPRTIAESGLQVAFVEDHLIRLLYFGLQMTGAELAEAAGLPYAAIQPLVRGLDRDHVIEVVGQTAPAEQNYRYALAPRGRQRADEALHRTMYHGPLPVPLEQYVAAVKAQSVGELHLRREELRAAFSDLVISDRLLDRLGPAINTNRSIFLHGAPGNGKTVICERLARLIGGAIFVPHAIEVDGSIILLYDTLNHHPVADETGRRYDGRWVRIHRPFIIASSELTFEALDLVRNETGRFYEMPPHVKANGGVFLIDDFGRQVVRPSDLLNRWIVPLEKRIDFLTLETGKKFELPFDPLLLFSTNLDVSALSDEAFQRRVPFRVNVPNPDEAQFTEVFRGVCAQRNIPFDLQVVDWLLATWWRPTQRPMRFVQPRDLLIQLVAVARYYGHEPSLTPELLEQACLSYFDLDDVERVNTAQF